jgi:hypothetical protein
MNADDRTRVNNITHCYDQFTGEPLVLNYVPPAHLLAVTLNEFFNRKKPIIVHFIAFFKHLPELQMLDVDDQVSLIKQNLRLLLPLNYALLKTPARSKFRYTKVRTIGCVNDVNVHSLFQRLSDSFVPSVTFDPIIIKLFVLVLFFTRHSFVNQHPNEYKQMRVIKQIHASYTELLWLYMIDKCGEKHAVQLFTQLITKYLYVQIMMDNIDAIVRLNADVDGLDSLLQTVLDLT